MTEEESLQVLDVPGDSVDEGRVGNFEETREHRPLDVRRDSRAHFVIALDFLVVLVQLLILVPQKDFRPAQFLAVVEGRVSASRKPRYREARPHQRPSSVAMGIDKHFLSSAILCSGITFSRSISSLICVLKRSTILCEIFGCEERVGDW